MARFHLLAVEQAMRKKAESGYQYGKQPDGHVAAKSHLAPDNVGARWVDEPPALVDSEAVNTGTDRKDRNEHEFDLGPPRLHLAEVYAERVAKGNTLSDRKTSNVVRDAPKLQRHIELRSQSLPPSLLIETQDCGEGGLKQAR